jgi:hypothetical protein
MSEVSTTSNSRLPALIVLLAALVPVLIRVSLLGEVPLGVDGGQWVAHGRTLFSAEHPRGMYPPLVPLLAWLLTLILPFKFALATLALAAAAAPGIGVGFFAVRIKAPRSTSALAAFAVSAAGMTGEAFLWGGYPQLVALGFVPLALLALEELLSPSKHTRSLRSSQVLLAGTVAAIACTSHLVLLSMVVALAALLLVRLRRGESRAALRSLFGPLVFWAFTAAVLAPVYISISETFSASQGSSRDSRFSQLTSAYQYVLRAELLPHVVLLLVALVWFSRSVTWHAALAAISATLCAVLLPYLLEERRLAYLAASALAMLLVVAYASQKVVAHGRRVFGILVALVVLVSSGLGLSRTRSDNDFYSYMTPAALELAEEVARFSASSDGVAVASVRSFPYGWWVEGVSARRTFSMTSPDVLYRASEKRDLSVVLGVFSASSDDPFPSSAGLAEAREHRVRLLVVPWAWGGVSSEELDDHAARCSDACGFSVVFQNDFGALVRVSP